MCVCVCASACVCVCVNVPIRGRVPRQTFNASLAFSCFFRSAMRLMLVCVCMYVCVCVCVCVCVFVCVWWRWGSVCVCGGVMQDLTQYIEKAALVQKCHAVDGMNFSKVLCVPYMYIYVYIYIYIYTPYLCAEVPSLLHF